MVPDFCLRRVLLYLIFGRTLSYEAKKEMYSYPVTGRGGP
jgi:hypothetical protein